MTSIALIWTGENDLVHFGRSVKEETGEELCEVNFGSAASCSSWVQACQRNPRQHARKTPPRARWKSGPRSLPRTIQTQSWRSMQRTQCCGAHFLPRKDRSIRPEGIFRERLPGTAEGYG